MSPTNFFSKVRKLASRSIKAVNKWLAASVDSMESRIATHQQKKSQRQSSRKNIQGSPTATADGAAKPTSSRDRSHRSSSQSSSVDIDSKNRGLPSSSPGKQGRRYKRTSQASRNRDGSDRSYSILTDRDRSNSSKTDIDSAQPKSYRSSSSKTKGSRSTSDLFSSSTNFSDLLIYDKNDGKEDKRHRKNPSAKESSRSINSRRRQSRSSSPEKLKQSSSQRKRSNNRSGKPASSRKERREKYSSSRSHSPVGRKHGTSSNSNKKGNKKKASTGNDRRRPKSDSSLDVSSKKEASVRFQDDTDIGTAAGKKKRRGRRQKQRSSSSTKQPSLLDLAAASSLYKQNQMETELQNMLNGSGALKDDMDTTTNSKASNKSGRSKKKKRSNKKSPHQTPESPGEKAVRITPSPEKDNGDLLPPLPNSTKTPKRTKSTRSTKSSASKSGKKKSKRTVNDAGAPPSPGLSNSESQSLKKKKSKKSGGKEIEAPPLSEGVTPKKSKKKKRSTTKSPNPNSRLPKVSGHSKAATKTKKPSSQRGAASEDEEVELNDVDRTEKANNSTKLSPGTLRRAQSAADASKSKPSPGTLRRAASASDYDGGSGKSAGNSATRLRRAKSLFGAVLKTKGAESVGDGDNSDNEYEVRSTEDNKQMGLLEWAKKKVKTTNSPGNSPGLFRKKRLGLKGRRGGVEDDDHEGLLSNAEDRSGQMSLLNLVENTPEEENLKKGSALTNNFIGEDNTIEERDKFKMPANITPAKTNGLANGQRTKMHDGRRVSDADLPPFSQIMSTAEITSDDDLSDIGDPESNIVGAVQEAAEAELIDGDEIVYNPERNDVVYDDRGHPGTVRMVHVLREILVEHQDDIEYSPEVYKVIKRRLKGRKFLLRTQHNGRTAWREATKSENVQLLADFFHEEMRELFGGSMTINDQGQYDEDIKHSVPPENPKKARSNNTLNRRNSGTHSSQGYSTDGSVTNKLLQKAIAEVKWAQELAKPKGDIATMNVGIDAEEKLISLIEAADEGPPHLAPLKEELDKLGELAKQMMYVSIAPLLERLDEIEEHMADYFEQLEEAEAELEMDVEEDYPPVGRDMSLEKDGEMYEVEMKSAAYDEEENFFDDNEEEEYHDDDDDEEPHPDEYDDESDEESATNVKEGEVLNCENNDGDVSSVGESGIYDESDSEDDDSELEDGEKNWAEFDDDDSDEVSSDEDSQSYEAGDSDDDDDSDVSDQPKRKKTIFDEPNPKLKQFFDRINHFFETRRRIEECAANKDASNKCRKIKAKTHSGGITKKDGGYKKEFQQRNTRGKVVQNFDELYDAANTAYSDFKSIVQQLVDEISGLDYKKNIILPELKPRYRAYEKAKTEYSHRDLGPAESWLYDICRAGIVCNTVKQLSEVSKWLTSNSNVVQAKNRFAEPAFNGYRDLLYHVSILYGDGLKHICEIQVHLRDIYVLNDQCGTIKHYDYFRPCFSNPLRPQEDALKDLQKMNKYNKIEGPFMKKLLKSEDPDQLSLFAGIFRNQLEEYDRSLELYRRVLSLKEEAHGSDNEEMAGTYLSIGLVLGAMGDTDESLQNLLKALAIQESYLGADHVEVADSYVEIGHMLSKRGDYSGAYTQYQRTLVIREKKLGKDHFLVIKSLQDIGLVLQKKGDLEDSEKQYRKALAIQKQVLGKDHMDLATTHSYIGKTLCLYGDFEKAMVEEKLALSMREKGLGKNHRSTAESHTAIGVLLFHKGDYKTARGHHNKALKIREMMLGKDDVECAISHRHLGELLSYYEGDYEGAVKELKRTQEILEANVGMDNPVTAESYLDLGHIHCRHGKHEEALAEYRRAKVILESNLGQTHPNTAGTYLCTGNALNLAGDHDGAMQMHRKALVVFESVLGNSHPQTADGYQSTGEVFAASGHPEMALSEHREALKIRNAVLRKDHPSVAESCTRIGNILLTGCDSKGNTNKRDPEAALEIYREALAITEERCGKDHPAAAVARFDVSSALMTLAKGDTSDAGPRRLDEAEEKLRSTLDVLREVEPLKEKASSKIKYYLGFGDEAAITGRACVALGTVLEQKGKDEQARESFVEGLERLIKSLGGDHPDTVEAESKLLSFVAES